MWILNAERRLRASELRHALMVDRGSTDLDPQKAPVIQTLLGYAQGVLMVEKASSTVRLVHYGLEECPFNNPTLFQSPHSLSWSFDDSPPCTTLCHMLLPIAEFMQGR
ncbi:hypothetical protein L873DRAFT_825050 [Choiromyces venosus 120613-1]|uniref:Uncharacterized protein n=1 Tax=Choiromyces venosus 120613-1 TaxID=1336337 RepID=A0A3N4JVZ6_9PEZI|nr:hypothetical protein L873DRAFT_825050 [Choiromyces venosus 120613-1]